MLARTRAGLIAASAREKNPLGHKADFTHLASVRLPARPASRRKGHTVLGHMRHQELWRAVGTHYGPTRIYGPTGHAIGGTAQQAFRSFYRSYRSRTSALSVTTTGRQRSVGVWTSPPPPEPA